MNLTINSEDESNYFYCGLLRKHYGTARTEETIDLILEALVD